MASAELVSLVIVPLLNDSHFSDGHLSIPKSIEIAGVGWVDGNETSGSGRGDAGSCLTSPA